MSRPENVLLWHWGREGAGAKFTFELVKELHRMQEGRIILSSAAESELSSLGGAIAGLSVDNVSTFSGSKRTLGGNLLAGLALAKLPMLARRFHRMLSDHQIDVAVCTFQSIWDVATLPSLRAGTVRYVQILHDAFFHPGDQYPLRQYILRKQIGSADALIVLSDHVGRQAITHFGFPADRIWTMDHGAFSFGIIEPAMHPRGSRPIRLLFFGRIIRYKGLERLLSAVHLLTRAGTMVDLVIAGAGDINPYASLLKSVSADVQNRWLSDDEIATYLSACDVVVLPYSEASQSGVAASAYAAGRPIVATPVGGLVEQVLHGITGLVAADLSAEAFAKELADLVHSPELFDRCARGASQHAKENLGWEKSASKILETVAAVRAMPRRGFE